MGWAIAAIALGASFGALGRWGLSLWLNPLSPQLPLGTLAANLVGGYLVGLALAFFTSHASGLTTFSTFSAEVVGMLLKGQMAWALATAGLHMLGSFLMTAAGIYTFQWMVRPA
jgi:CrcB protein